MCDHPFFALRSAIIGSVSVLAETPVEAAVTSASDALPDDHPLDARRNVITFTGDTTAFMVGTYFIPVTTVIVGLASLLTTDKTLIGVVGMVWSVSWFLPQLVAANMVRGKRRQKRYLMIPSIIGRNLFLVIALWLFVTQAVNPLLTVWVLIVSLAVFNVMDALAGVAWFDMMSRTLSARMRARVVAIGQFAGGVLGIGAALIVQQLLAPSGPAFPNNYAVIFFCTWVFMMISLVIIAFLRETPMAESEQQHAADTNLMTSLKASLREDPVLRRVLLVRALTGIEIMAASFYLVFAREQLGLDESAIGTFNIAIIIGGLAGVALFGWLAERFTALSVIRSSALMQLISPTIALLFVLAGATAGVSTQTIIIGFFIVFLLRGAIEHSLVLGVIGYLMDSAPQRHRAMYVGAINTLSGVVALSPVLGGIIIDALSAQGMPNLAYGAVFGLVAVSVAAGIWVSLKLPHIKVA
jgi:MFS family permease